MINAGHRGYPAEALLAGTSAQVADEVARIEQWGFDELLTRSLVGRQDLALASIDRLGRFGPS